MEDHELLREYAESRTEAAFAELVSRHISLVYSTALRMVNEPQFAKDVAQTVFIELARNPQSIREPRALVGWLYRTTRFDAASALRTEQRRRQRENVAMEMNLLDSNPETAWQNLAPHIDEAMGTLDATDQTAVVLRFFENKSLRQVGVALGVSDDAAQKRVSRAVERLRECLAKQGFALGATGLIALISANAVEAAPVGLATTISGAALASVGATGGITFLKLMAMTKLKLGVVGAVVVMGVIVALLMWRESSARTGQNNPASSHAGGTATNATTRSSSFRRGNVPPLTPAERAEKIVADKVIQLGRKRRELVNAIARRLNTSVPPEIEAFFDALEAGNWEELNSRWEFLAVHGTGQYERSKHDRPDLQPYWQAVLDAYLPAQEAHEWPAQKLLDYGNAILDSLRPGMVYVGGTDPGRSVPALLNETGAGAHIMLTQNALADGSYLDHLQEVYGGRLNTLSHEDSQRVYDDYKADAQKRLQHDLDFPDEPKQVRPGEDVRIVDGKVQVSGQFVVMTVNERLLQMLMQKNPDLSFALEESRPLQGLYADSVPLGPLMELHAQDSQNIFTPERAGQSLDYWRTTAQNLLADPESAASTYTLKAYSHDINSTANLLAAHNYSTEAEEAYRLSSQLWPGNPDSVCGLASILARTGRTEEANQTLDNFVRNHQPTFHHRDVSRNHQLEVGKARRAVRAPAGRKKRPQTQRLPFCCDHAFLAALQAADGAARHPYQSGNYFWQPL